MRLFLLALALLAARPAAGASLPYNPYVDAPVTGLAVAGILGSELLFKAELAPRTCAWCEPPGLDRATRDALRWGSPGTADLLSNLGAYALVPALAFGGLALAAYRQHEPGRLGTDALIVLETCALALDLNQIVKFNAARERPFVHALPEAEKGSTPRPLDNDVSFYSGHTGFTVALATAAGTVAWLHHSPLAPAIWASGLSTALLTGYLRIGADKHWLTDVLTGAAAGAALGFGLPYALHRP